MTMADAAIHSGLAHPFDLRFHHAGVSVPDLESAIAWYGTMLGFEVDSRDIRPPLQAKVAFLRRGNLRLELFEVPGAAPLPEERRDPNQDVLTHGNKHVAYAVKDVHAVADELKSRGADVVVVKDVGPAVSLAYIRDNSGNLIELFQQPDLW